MDIQRIMEQAQGMQQRMLELQEELGGKHITHEVGEGLVAFTCTGRKAPIGITLDPRVLELSDVTLLEDLIMLAIQGTADKADTLLTDRTEAMMAEMGLPKDFQLPGSGGLRNGKTINTKGQSGCRRDEAAGCVHLC